MGDRRCCCEDCYIFNDEFNRSNSTDLGGDWVELAGDWEILDNELYEPGTAGAKVRGTGQVSAASAGEMTVDCTFVDAAVGMVYELYAAADDSLSSFFKSRHEKTGANTWRTTIYKDGAGADYVDQTPTPYPDADHVGGWICVDKDGNVKAGVRSLDAYAWAVGLGGKTGRRYGVGHQNTDPSYFDSFFATEIRTSKVLCDACWCPCCTTLPGKSLALTFVLDDTVSPNRADCLDGQSTTVDWEWDSGLQPWIGDITINANDWDFRLVCDSTADPDCQGQNWKLTLVSQCAAVGTVCGGAGCTSYAVPELSTCSPLRLVFGPYQLTVGLLGCTACYSGMGGPTNGSYYIEITELP